MTGAGGEGGDPEGVEGLIHGDVCRSVAGETDPSEPHSGPSLQPCRVRWTGEVDELRVPDVSSGGSETGAYPPLEAGVLGGRHGALRPVHTRDSCQSVELTGRYPRERRGDATREQDRPGDVRIGKGWQIDRER